MRFLNFNIKILFIGYKIFFLIYMLFFIFVIMGRSLWDYGIINDNIKSSKAGNSQIPALKNHFIGLSQITNSYTRLNEQDNVYNMGMKKSKNKGIDVSKYLLIKSMLK